METTKPREVTKGASKDALLPLDGPCIEHHLVVSTCHVTEEDMNILEVAGADAQLPIIVTSTTYGAYVYTHATSLSDEVLKEYRLSDAFIHLVKLSRLHKCQYITLDRDGPEYEELPRFDW